MRVLSYFVFVAQNAALRQIEERHLQIHFFARGQRGRRFPGPARKMREHPVAIGQFHAIQSARQGLDYGAFDFDAIRSGHVKISGSPSVTRTVCSK